MAEENKNIGGNQPGEYDPNVTRGLKELLDLSRKLKIEQGDFRDLIKESNKALSKSLATYDTIESRLDSLNRGNLNIKQINKELNKVEFERSTLSKKINEFKAKEAESSEESRKNLSKYFEIEKEILKKEEEIKEQTKIVKKLEGDSLKVIEEYNAQLNTKGSVVDKNIKNEIELTKELTRIQTDYSKYADKVSELEKDRVKIVQDIAFIQNEQIIGANNLSDIQKQSAERQKQSLESTLKHLDKQLLEQRELEKSSKVRLELKNLEIKDAQELIRQDKLSVIEAEKKLSAGRNTLQLKENELQTQITSKDKTFEALDVEQKAYVLNLKALGVSEKALEIIMQRLEAEKKLKKDLGLEGELLGAVVSKLGLGSDVYEELIEKVRDSKGEFGFLDQLGFLTSKFFNKVAQAAKSPLFWILQTGAAIKATFNSAVKAINQGAQAVIGSGGAFTSFVQPISEFLSKIPLIGGLLGGIVDLFAKLVDFGITATSETEKFARALGMSYETAKDVEYSMRAFAESSEKTFLNFDKLRQEALKLSEALGINAVLSNEILADSIQLKEQFGIEEETAKNLAEAAILNGRTQIDIFRSILQQNSALKISTGLSFRMQQIIKQASSFGGVLGLTFAKYPERLSKSLLITKALGMDLQKLDSIASSFLDFESSISKEFESQLITGKDINLAKARELAMNNNLAGLAVEINKQVGSSEEFINMNRFAQNALSEAVGMTRDELADMLKKQELFAAAGAKDLKTYKERIAQMEKEGTLKDEFLQKLTKEQKEYFLSSTANERIANFMERIRQNFASIVSSPGFRKMLDDVMKFLESPDAMDQIINKISSFFSYVVKIVTSLLDGLDSVPGISIDPILRKELREYSETLDKDISLRNFRAKNKKEESVDENVIKQKTNAAIKDAEESNKALRRPEGAINVQVYNQIDPITGKAITKVIADGVVLDGKTGPFVYQTYEPGN